MPCGWEGNRGAVDCGTEALRDMQAVAEHMNEMQKIYDEYGAVFDSLASDGSLLCRVDYSFQIQFSSFQ